MSDVAADSPRGNEGSVSAEWLRSFVADALDDAAVDEFVRRVGGGIREQVVAVAEDPVLDRDVLLGIRAQWCAFLRMLPEPEYRHELPVEAGHLAVSLAARGMDLGVLLKVYRAANQLVFGYVTEITEVPLRGSPGRHESLVFMWSRAGAWIDDSVEQLIETFYDERRRLQRGALARRDALIDALLADAPSDGVDPTNALGHPIQQYQTALVAWMDESPEYEVDRLVDAAGAVARALGAPSPLVREVGSRDLWAWCATPSRPDLTALASVEGLLAETGIRATVGSPARGPVGFRSTHLEARAAHHLAVTAVSMSRIVLFADVELLCATAGNDALLDRMVEREIGPLLVADKNMTMVRQTVLAFLANRNVDEIAAELFVHKNTVRYRLARAEELLGHPLTERAALVELALRRVAIFGPPAVDAG